MTSWGTVEVEYHQFSFAEDFADTLDVRSSGPVFDYGPGFITIHTGIASGPVRLIVDNLAAAPDESGIGDWEAVAEVFLRISTPLRVTTLSGDIVDGYKDYAGPLGVVGIRVNARGRDRNWDLTVDQPTEDYWIQVWPATPEDGSPRLIKRSDVVWGPADEPPPAVPEAVDVEDARVRRFGPLRFKGD